MHAFRGYLSLVQRYDTKIKIDWSPNKPTKRGSFVCNYELWIVIRQMYCGM
jgi:hypothetical protein